MFESPVGEIAGLTLYLFITRYEPGWDFALSIYSISILVLFIDTISGREIKTNLSAISISPISIYLKR